MKRVIWYRTSPSEARGRVHSSPLPLLIGVHIHAHSSALVCFARPHTTALRSGETPAWAGMDEVRDPCLRDTPALPLGLCVRGPLGGYTLRGRAARPDHPTMGPRGGLSRVVDQVGQLLKLAARLGLALGVRVQLGLANVTVGAPVAGRPVAGVGG